MLFGFSLETSHWLDFGQLPLSGNNINTSCWNPLWLFSACLIEIRGLERCANMRAKSLKALANQMTIMSPEFWLKWRSNSESCRLRRWFQDISTWRYLIDKAHLRLIFTLTHWACLVGFEIERQFSWMKAMFISEETLITIHINVISHASIILSYCRDLKAYFE